MSPRSASPLLAILLMMGAMICIAASDAIGKHLTQNWSIWQVLWIRSWVWLVLAILWLSKLGTVPLPFRSSAPGLQLLRALVLVVEVAVFITAFRVLPLGDVTAILAAAPLVVLALAAFFLNEQVGLHRWIAVFIGLAGMLMIARPGGSVYGLYAFLPILGALLWGTYQVLNRHMSFKDSEDTTLLWTGAVLFLTTSMIAPFFWRSPGTVEIWTLFFLAGLLNTLGHFALIAALHRAEASALQPFSYTQTLAALLIGFLVFSEIPDIWTSIGTIAIIGGGLYALYRERKNAIGQNEPAR